MLHTSWPRAAAAAPRTVPALHPCICAIKLQCASLLLRLMCAEYRWATKEDRALDVVASAPSFDHV